jgi:hypothetical protein
MGALNTIHGLLPKVKSDIPAHIDDFIRQLSDDGVTVNDAVRAQSTGIQKLRLLIGSQR